MAYYYLAAQLPGLSYGQAAPMSSHAFKELAEASLRADDAVWLNRCVLDPGVYGNHGIINDNDIAEEGLPDFFIRWYEWERTLRLNLARWRAARLKRDISPDAPDYPPDAVKAAKAASAMDSPLEAELFLDEARWTAIDSFQGFDYFDRNTIYAYLIKLLLLERRSRFRVEEGFAEYRGIYAAVMKAAGSGSDGALLRSQSGEPE
jgi:hypothetical protein